MMAAYGPDAFVYYKGQQRQKDAAVLAAGAAAGKDLAAAGTHSTVSGDLGDVAAYDDQDQHDEVMYFGDDPAELQAGGAKGEHSP